jgi:hypothetical protein
LRAAQLGRLCFRRQARTSASAVASDCSAYRNVVWRFLCPSLFRIVARLKLASVTDRNGNTLTYDDSGIFSSTGRSVTFLRDTAGDLASVDDRQSNHRDQARE